MKHTLKCAVVLMLSMNVLESPAQFYTAEKVGPAADTLSISTDPYVRDVLHETKPKPKADSSLSLSPLVSKPAAMPIGWRKCMPTTSRSSSGLRGA